MRRNVDRHQACAKKHYRPTPVMLNGRVADEVGTTSVPVPSAYWSVGSGPSKPWIHVVVPSTGDSTTGRVNMGTPVVK